jgi:hypothetical protein
MKKRGILERRSGKLLKRRRDDGKPNSGAGRKMIGGDNRKKEKWRSGWKRSAGANGSSRTTDSMANF